MAAPIIETKSLGKTFGLAPVLRDTEFRLLPGAGAIVIGGNGAGKSTLLKILSGLIAPSDGCALVFGEDTRRFGAGHRRRIGMVSHQSFLYPSLTARENLVFFAELYGISDPSATAESWLERVGLSGFGGERVGTFSRGMEQRLAMARAMIHGPSLLLLDEPFAALDAEGRARIESLMKSALDEGSSVVATAHQPFAIEGCAFDLYEIVRGQVVPFEEQGQLRRGGRLRSLLRPRSS